MNTTELQKHETFMRTCIERAKQAKANGESPCGSIIVRDDEIIGEGIECSKAHQDITYHAEIEAIRKTTQQLDTQDLSDCIMYTTHEPCIMCSYMIRHTKIKKVVTGISVGDIGGFSSQHPLLLDESIEKWGTPPALINGILENECKRL